MSECDLCAGVKEMNGDLVRDERRAPCMTKHDAIIAIPNVYSKR